jgi:hypothetical protein
VVAAAIAAGQGTQTGLLLLLLLLASGVCVGAVVVYIAVVLGGKSSICMDGCITESGGSSQCSLGCALAACLLL